VSTYTPIASVTLSSAQSSVTFSGIPQTYTDLVLVTTNTSAGGLAGVYLGQINGDTGTNYSETKIFGTGSVAGSDRNQNATGVNIGLSNSSQCNNIWYFMNYSNTTTYKTVLARGNSAAGQTRASVALWRNTAAITSFRIDGVTFDIGSTFNLYGIDASLSAQAKATGGDTIVTDGTYWYHTFLSSGTFTPTEALTADYLVVAGGGAGGAAGSGAGGGAGGLRSTVTVTGGGGSLPSALSLTTSTNYTITVGAGGTGVSGTAGTSGSNSSISGGIISTVTSTGGGFGAGGNAGNGDTGGSGGGGSAAGTGSAGTANEGYAGGDGGGASLYSGGGGGGAGAVGTAGTNLGGNGGNGGNGVQITAFATATSTGANSGYYAGGGGGAGQIGQNGGTGTGDGGDGVATSITGSSVTYAGGGGGARQSSGSHGAGGSGGGGAGGFGGSAGTANTGGGGGGGATINNNQGSAGGNGGSGIVIVRYAV